MEAIDPVDDGLSSESFKAIDVIFAKNGFDPAVIFLAGVHNGNSAAHYLQMFPNAILYGFEPDIENLKLASNNLKIFKNRVHLFPFALAEEDGEENFNLYSHSATHSFFEIGKNEYWDEKVEKVDVKKVKTISIDSFVLENQISNIDLLHLDIQGGELAALRGSKDLLKNKSIFLIRCESEFEDIYFEQPLFWDIGKYLSKFQYRFIKNVDLKYRAEVIPRLVWADSLFLKSNT